MKLKESKLWVLAFLAPPILYFASQFLPYYHSGGRVLTSLGSLFWFTESHTQTSDFIAMFHWGFRVNDLVPALLVTQFVALFLIIMTVILKSSGTIAVMSGCWGLYGLISFLTNRALTFSAVMVYGGIAGISMLLVFLAAVVLSAIYLSEMYKNYRKKYVLALN